MIEHRRPGRFLFAAVVVAIAACTDELGPGVAVTLSLHSVDGVVVPVRLPTPGGLFVSVADGKLQGTNWGHACGIALRLVEGAITTEQVPDCRLTPGEERTFTFTLADSRFPAGAHVYRFVP